MCMYIHTCDELEQRAPTHHLCSVPAHMSGRHDGLQAQRLVSGVVQLSGDVGHGADHQAADSRHTHAGVDQVTLWSVIGVINRC
jgi:hypothetical protein